MSIPLRNLPAFRLDAACDPGTAEAYFPTKGDHSPLTKKTCAGCPARQACLDYAIANGERYGIWGGYSETERRALKRSGAHVAVEVVRGDDDRLHCPHCPKTYAYLGLFVKHVSTHPESEAVA